MAKEEEVNGCSANPTPFSVTNVVKLGHIHKVM